MKNRLLTGYLVIILASLLAAGCTGQGTGKKKEPVAKKTATAAPVIDRETTLLLKHLEENGDYVNSRYFPSLIKASIVHDELGDKNLLIDHRRAAQVA